MWALQKTDNTRVQMYCKSKEIHDIRGRQQQRKPAFKSKFPLLIAEMNPERFLK